MSVEQDSSGQWNPSSPSWSLCNSAEESSGAQDVDSEGLSPTAQFRPPYYSITIGQDKTLQWDPPADSEELAIALSYHFPVPKTLEAKMQAATQKWLHSRKKQRVACGSARVSQSRPVAKSPVTEQQPQQASPNNGDLISSKASKPTLRTSYIRDADSGARILQLDPSGQKLQWGIIPTDDSEGCSPIVDNSEIPGMISWRIDTGEVMPPASRKRPYADEERIRVARNRGKVCAYHRRRKQKCDPDICNQNKQRKNPENDPISSPWTSRPIQATAALENQPPIFEQDQDWKLWDDSGAVILPGMTPQNQHDVPFPEFIPDMTQPYHLKGSTQVVPGTEPTQTPTYAFCDEWSSLWQTSVPGLSPPSSFAAISGTSSDLKERQSFSESSDTSNATKTTDHQSEIKDLMERRSQRMEGGEVRPHPANNKTETSGQTYSGEFQYPGHAPASEAQMIPGNGPVIYPGEVFDYDLELYLGGHEFHCADFGYNCVDASSVSDVQIRLQSTDAPRARLTDHLQVQIEPAVLAESKSNNPAFEDQFTSEEWQQIATGSTLPAPSSSAKDDNCGIFVLDAVQHGVANKEKSYPSCETSYTQAPNFATVPNACMPSSYSMRRASVISSGSQDSRYRRLRSSKVSAAGMRECESGAVSRRDSTNSMTSHESNYHHPLSLSDLPPNRRAVSSMLSVGDQLPSKPRRSSLWEGTSTSSDEKHKSKPLGIPFIGYTFKSSSHRVADHSPSIDDLTSALSLAHV